MSSIFTFACLPFVKLYQLKNYDLEKFLKNIFTVKLSLSGKNFITLTKRLARFLLALFLVEFLLWFLILAEIHVFWIIILDFFVNFLVLPLIIVICHFILLPIEVLIKKYYIKKALKKLKNFKGIKIAITGSFGKTSTKNILKKMLEAKYKVVASPLNFNTPMGLCRTVNEKLEADTEILIVEMGARRRGEIKELCDMLSPDIGIVTSVGEQHIETFGSLEQVKKTKFELCESLGTSKKCYFDCYNENTRELFDKAICKKEGLGKSVDVEIHKVDERGLSFSISGKFKKVDFQTKLLGRFMARNISLCFLVAKDLGVPEKEIKKVIKDLKPFPHRLELISRGDLKIIDDAYNSNFDGFCEALQVLGLFEEEEKIVITPGMVELGERQYELNFKIGKIIASSCDKVIVMNKTNKKALKNGILSEKFNKNNLFFAESRNEMNEIIKNNISRKAVILFENDLPDDYV